MGANGNKSLSTMILSADPELRGTVHDVASQEGFAVQLEINTRPSNVTESQLDRISQYRPAVLIIDFDDDLEAGCRVAARVVEMAPSIRIVAASWSESRESLVAAMRAGVAELLQKPVSRPHFEESLARIRRRLGDGDDGGKEEGRVIAFFGPKGGAGSTTVASNFAIHLHQLTGRETLLVDLDLELGEIAIFLGLDPRYSVVDLLQNLHRLDAELLDTFLETHDSGIAVLAAPYRPREGREVSAAHVREMLEYLSEHFPYVVVDISNSLSDASIGALEAAREIMVVTQVDIPSIRNIQRCRELFDSLPAEARDLRLILNRYGGKEKIARDDLEEALGTSVFWTLSSDYDSVVSSINTGRPLGENGSPCSREIRGLVAKTIGVEENAASRRGGLLSRAIGRLTSGRNESGASSRRAPTGSAVGGRA